MRSLYAASLATTIALSIVHGASAEEEGAYIDSVLTVDRQDELCVPAGVRRRVDPAALANAMLDEARVPMYLRMRSNPSGKAQSLRMESAIYAIREHEPFPGQTSEAATGARDRIQGMRLSLLNIFIDGATEDRAYVVAAKSKDKYLENFFAGRTVIYCEEPEETRQAGGKKKAVGSWLADQKIMIRNSIEDLTEENYKKLEPGSAAHVSYKDDLHADTKSIEIEATVGKSIETENFGTFIPFLSYQNKTAEKIETVAAGGLWYGSFESFDVSAGPRYVWNLEEGTETVKGSAFVYPNVTIGGFTTGIYNQRGTVWFRPDAYLIAEAGETTAGSDPIFEDGDDYYGVGARASLDIYIEALRANVGVAYRYLALFSLPIDEADRFSAAVDFTLDEAEHFSIGVGYEDGRNDETFEEVENYSLRFGVKY